MRQLKKEDARSRKAHGLGGRPAGRGFPQKIIEMGDERIEPLDLSLAHSPGDFIRRHLLQHHLAQLQHLRGGGLRVGGRRYHTGQRRWRAVAGRRIGACKTA